MLRLKITKNQKISLNLVPFKLFENIMSRISSIYPF
jgi:hypothetical protein